MLMIQLKCFTIVIKSRVSEFNKFSHIILPMMHAIINGH